MPLIADLKTRRDAIGVELAALDGTKKGGGINTFGAGTGLDHTKYKLSLYEELKMLDERIAYLEQTDADSGDGLFEENLDVMS